MPNGSPRVPGYLPRVRSNGQRPRERDRRTGLSQLLASVVSALVAPDGKELREAFEYSVCRLLGLRSVRLQPGQALATGPSPLVRESGAIDVPVRPGPAVLHVVPPVAGLDAWDLQLLDASADLAGLVLEVERAHARPPKGAGGLGIAPGLVGSSPAMADLRDRLARVGRSEAAVLVEGESGVGKELVARQIHRGSRRARGPFVAVNCAALVETLLEAELFGIEDRTATGVRGRRGKFEQADGGTLFLDEIGDLSMTAQAKLLRALQEMVIERVGGHVPLRVDVRVIAATNRTLGALVEAGRFRLDLFYRLNCVDVRVPPLRTRRSDIKELVELFVARYGEERVVGVTPEALEALMEYEWPGNVRELERVIQRAVALTDSALIEPEDLPLGLGARYEELFQPALDHGETLRAFGSRYVRLVLHRSNNNKREACRRLGISYHTLQAYLRLAASSDARADQPRAGIEEGPAPDAGPDATTGQLPVDAAGLVQADASGSVQSIDAGSHRRNVSDGGDAGRDI